MAARLVPELDVAALDRSLAFYVEVIGFRVLFGRPEERFAYLELAGVHLMWRKRRGLADAFARPRSNIPMAAASIS